MTLAQLRAALRARIGNPSVTDVPDTPNLDQHINDAYQEILNKYKFKKRRKRARFTTQVGVDKYIVSDITDVVYKAWDRTNGMPLEYVGKSILSQRDYDATPNALVQNAHPRQWTHMETYIQLLPPPDGAYVVEFIYKVIYTPLAAVGDIPQIPQTWHRGISILAAAHYYGDEAGDPVKESYHKNAFKDWASDQPVEEHEASEAIESGVEIPTLGGNARTSRRPDRVWWDILP